MMHLGYHYLSPLQSHILSPLFQIMKLSFFIKSFLSHGFSLFFLLSLIFRVPSSLISHSPYTHKTFFLCGIKKATMDDRTLRLPLVFSVFLFFTCQIMGYSYSCPKKKTNKNLKNFKKICDKKKSFTVITLS